MVAGGDEDLPRKERGGGREEWSVSGDATYPQGGHVTILGEVVGSGGLRSSDEDYETGHFR